MKVLCIPDVHGSSEWEKTISEWDNVDYIIFLGDYFDSWNNNWVNNNQLNNFLKICNFAKTNEKVKLCIGNHDMAYLMGDYCVSGYQTLHESEIKENILNNLDLLNIVINIDDWYFSHGGISSEWKNRFYDDVDEKDLIDKINSDFHNKYFNPFTFIYSSKLSEYADISGNNRWQSPLWIRPYSLCANPYFKNQIVGHTELNDIERYSDRKDIYDILFIDSAQHNNFIIMDTEKNNYDFVNKVFS